MPQRDQAPTMPGGWLLVYQMGKVGSRSFVAAIEKLPGIERDHAGGGRVALGAGSTSSSGKRGRPGPRRNDRMEPLRFLHTPKTAGTTLTFILRRRYEGSAHFHFSGNVGEDLKRYDALPDEVRKQIARFTGHAYIKTGIPAADDIPIITLLREPVARAKSFCQHVSEGKSPYLLPDLFPPDAFDLDE